MYTGAEGYLRSQVRNYIYEKLVNTNVVEGEYAIGLFNSRFYLRNGQKISWLDEIPGSYYELCAEGGFLSGIAPLDKTELSGVNRLSEIIIWLPLYFDDIEAEDGGEFEVYDNGNGQYSDLSDSVGYTDNEYWFIHKGFLVHMKDQDNVGSEDQVTLDIRDLASYNPTDDVIKKDNIDYTLKPYISKWYNALRTVALVGLLSVLVYIGIRIILSSSSAQDKAKYKNMLKDWVVAICILFVLHYVMAFMLQFNKALNNIFVGSVITESLEGNSSDKLMNTIRGRISDLKNISGWDAGAYTLMWLVLVILTATFTFQYLKRVVYMAFLTMIAPMIALTYPLDKIKDSKAQAFSFWLKEYIFQCLIQPVHLLLYTMFIGSAIDFATKNPLYALVALGFLVPAEKLIKQMFGMKSETSAGNFSAAMGGAAVMSMMNKLKGVGPKNKKEEEQQSSGGKSGVRTSSNRSGGTSSGGSGGASGSAPLEQGQSEGGAPAGGTPSPVVGDGAATPVGNSTATTTQWEEFDRANERSRQARENATNQNSSSGPSRLNKFGRGLRGTGHIIGRAIGGPKGIKYRGRKLTGKALGLLGGAAGATIGLAAAIASGDESKILPNMAGGFIAGDAVGERIAKEGYGLKDKVTSGASDYANVFKEGYMSRDLETFKSEMIGQEYAGIRITEENVEEIFNRIQELRNSGTEI